MKISTTEKPKPLPIDRARAYVAKMSPAIAKQEGDKQTFTVACKLREFGLSQSDAWTVLLEYNQRCQPPWSEQQLRRKLKCAFSRANPNPKLIDGLANTASALKDAPEAVPKWPAFNEHEQKRIIEFEKFGLSDLYDLSPVKFHDDKPHTIEILNSIFPANPLVCCGKTSMEFWTKPLWDFGKSVERYQFIVPSPMSKLTGKIQDPEPEGPFESAHTKDNTGERIYGVVEFDKGSSDDHAAILHHLTDYAHLVLAVHSGGKSLHGWFNVSGSPEARIFRFYRYAVSLGADRATFLKSQFVRMPDGRRSNGARQCVYYFDPPSLTDHV